MQELLVNFSEGRNQNEHRQMGKALIINAEASKTVNYAMQQNDIPVINRLMITNNGNEDLTGLEVRISCDPCFAEDWKTHIEVINAGQAYNLGAIDLFLSNAFLSSVNERITGKMIIEVLQDEIILSSLVQKIEMLSLDEWNGLCVIPELIAAFIMPNHPSIESILSDVSDTLKQWSGESSLSGYQTKDPSRVILTVNAIYSIIQKLGIRYINPPASFEEIGQKVRLPDRIMENKMGTCLDLALFTAACIEQAGLNPIILLTKGHAFTGFWTIEDTFMDTVIDEPLRIIKRVELREICLLESTLLTSDRQIPFQHAVEEGFRKLKADDFLYAIDISRARKGSRIRPLPLKFEDASVKISLEKPSEGLISTASPSIDNMVPIFYDNDEQDSGNKPSSRLENWKRNLLDLSLRNRLLNFKETKKNIKILCPNLPSFEDALADGVKFKIISNSKRNHGGNLRDDNIHFNRTGKRLSEESLIDELKNHRLYSELTEGELNKRLLDIYRSSRSEIEENGTNTLFLALGFLEWYENDNSSQPRSAPIILLPLEVERPSVIEGFSMNQRNEEAILNTTLLELLSKDFGKTIPGLDPIPTDEHGIDVPLILNIFRQQIKDMQKWIVKEEAWIGLFSFSKFLMWWDLEARKEELLKNKVVNHLVNNPNHSFPANGTFPDAERLDDTHKPEYTFCPLSADSSQLAAVYAASEEKSFVLQGPPGTGKSQTITNLVANSLASGKRVLFVAEKMAALNVVYKRLSNCGLGDFCLELHSNKSQKRNVIEQLGQALSSQSANNSAQWLQHARRLENLRNELNSYVRELHRKRTLGESIFQGISKLISLNGITEVNLFWSSPDVITPEYHVLLTEIADKLDLAVAQIGHPSLNVWKPVNRRVWNPGFKNDTKKAIDELKEICEVFVETVGEVSQLLSLDNNKLNRNEIESLGELVNLLVNAPSTPQSLISSPDWESLQNGIDKWIEHGRKRDELRKILFDKYDGEILELDLESLLEALKKADNSWFLPKWFGRWKVSGTLKKVLKLESKIDGESMVSDIERAIHLRNEEKLLVESGDEARSILGKFWNEGEADWEEVVELKKWSCKIRQIAQKIAGTDLTKFSYLRNQWAQLISQGNELIRETGNIGVLLCKYKSEFSFFSERLKTLESILSLNEELAWGNAHSGDFLGNVMKSLGDWNKNIGSLKSWCFWMEIRCEAVKNGLGPLILSLENDEFQSGRIVDIFNKSFYKWWVESSIDSETILSSFYSPDFNRKILEFRKIDSEFTELTKQEIRARLYSSIPEDNGIKHNKNSEMGILKNQIQRKKGHMSIRKLFEKIPNTVLRLKPCFLMSPISVAQYLDPTFPGFDLVVFDEASQIPSWDAIGAIARGNELIVVGDPKQLPPTNFFSRADEQEDFEEGLCDLESILDDCMAAQLPTLDLRWHYRSLDESLISFSNHHYYKNKLLTFPSPNRSKSVSFKYIQGKYDKGKSRTNKDEAQAIVSDILRRLKDPVLSRYSIGVVTFNIGQQNLIEDLLDEARRNNPEIEQYFSKDISEPVFVKNLENVQGDEREVIMFSICYGPDSQGRVSVNFGAINRDGGERRLNVAVTRARREMIVFSSIKGEQIDLSKTRSRGVADLKSFLEYAEQGQVAIEKKRTFSTDAECESIFEEQVYDKIVEMGYKVHAQVGCSGYRIDLAIVDPEKPGRYLIGIECDGANYHRAKTARDRDRLRESILRKLGWNLYRIWSTDWWENQKNEIERLKVAIEEAALKPSIQPNTDEIEIPDIIAKLKADSTRELKEDFTSNTDYCSATMDLPVYNPCIVNGIHGSPESFYSHNDNVQICSFINYIVQNEGPISLTTLSKRLSVCWQFSKITKKVKERILALISYCDICKQVSDTDVFLWPRHIRPEEYTDFRVPGEDESQNRAISDIPPEEIMNAVLFILKQSISLPKESLINDTARILGIKRTGRIVNEVIGNIVEIMLRTNQIKDQNGMIVI